MNSYDKISEGFKLIIEGFEGFSTVIADIANKFSETCENLVNNLNSVSKRKLTKKKFCKLLQSYGIQRNEINVIVKNNKCPYTYEYLWKILKYRRNKLCK